MKNKKENPRKSKYPNHCSECKNFGLEDLDGFGYCEERDVQTHCGRTACNHFNPELLEEENNGN